MLQFTRTEFSVLFRHKLYSMGFIRFVSRLFFTLDWLPLIHCKHIQQPLIPISYSLNDPPCPYCRQYNC
jgi:hypothetical protein